jgi:putative oxidoreductase
MVKDFGLLILRLALGGLLGGHGSQKSFGWFGGFGLKGTAGWLESLGLKPGHVWATGAAASELGGGLLTALGLFYPLGPIATIGSMIMATAKAHWGKPIWVTEGGAELPATNIAIATALAMTGPGRFSLDKVFGIRVPNSIIAIVIAAEAAFVTVGVLSRPAPTKATQDHSAAKVESGQGSESL